MQESIWTASLASFHDELAGTRPAPAGVTASAVAANLGLGLLIKALGIIGKKKNVASLLDAARRESAHLKQSADDDIAAFDEYMDCLRRKQPAGAAMRKAIEVPMTSARSAVAALDLCAEAAGLVHAFVAADLGAAAALLSGAARAMLLSVDYNIGQLRSDQKYHADVTAERKQLEVRAVRQSEAVLRQISRLVTK